MMKKGKTTKHPVDLRYTKPQLLLLFAVAHQRGLSDEETLGLAAACGAANCLAKAPGLIDPQEVERIFRQVQVQPLQSKCHTC